MLTPSPVVSAYHDGHQLFRAIKKKWDKHRQQASTDLELSLTRSREDILTHWNAHAARLGARYEEGDSIAREQMKDIVINLQWALLTHLRCAGENNVSIDILALLSASDYGRARTISVLHELYQRLAQTAPIPWPIVAGSPVIDPSSSLGYYVDLIERLSVSQTADARSLPTGLPALTGAFSASPPELHGFLRVGEPSSPPQQGRRASTLGSISAWWTHRQMRGSRSSEGSSGADVEVVPRPGFSANLLVTPAPEPAPESVADSEATAVPPRRVKKRHSLSERDMITRRITRKLTKNPWMQDANDSGTEPESELETDEEDLRPSSADQQPPKTVDEPTSMAVSPALPETRLPPPPPSVISDSTNSNHSGSHTLVGRGTSVGTYWPPSKDNRYSGFCKGAWKLSSGLGGFKIFSEPIGYFILSSRWRCYRCYFDMPLAAGSREEHRYDTKVYLHSATGIQYRWAFLAKSHVACKRPAVSTPNHVRGSFGCIFCCAELDEPAPIFDSLDEFMGHLGSRHRGLHGAALLDRTRCVVGRVATEREDFDLNIPPLALK